MTTTRRIEVVADPGALARAGAAEFVSSAEEAVKARGAFTVALAGGSTPRALYRVLAAEHASGPGGLPWDHIHVFWGDERHVPPDHAESNYAMAREAFLSKVPLPVDHVHRIRAESPDAGRAAALYEREIIEHFALRDGERPRFDLILLGMGSDGHTASLFPGSPVLKEGTALVAAPWVEKLSARRITLTAPVLNRARRVLFLVSGEEKAETLRSVLEGDLQPDRLPAQIVRPVAGEVLWLVDAPAARLLRHTEHSS